MQPVPAELQSSSEAQLRPELQVARVKGATCLSEMHIPNAVVQLTFSAGQLKVGVIQDIEGFRSELEFRPLSNLEALEQRGVPFHEAWTGKRVAPEGPGIARRRPLEYATRVVIAPLAGGVGGIPPVGPHVVIRAAEVRNRSVGSVVGLKVVIEITCATRAVAEWLPMRTRVICNRTVELPPAQHRLQDSTAAPENRQFPNVIGAECVTNIEDGVAAIQRRQGLIAGIAFPCPFMV
jgi:hypothetical protein